MNNDDGRRHFVPGAHRGAGGDFAAGTVGRLCRTRIRGEPVTVRLSELYEIRLYEDGYACVYYGYANPWERDTAWYRLPDGTADAVKTYIEGLTS